MRGGGVPHLSLVPYPLSLAARRPDLHAYLNQEMVPAAHQLGATARVLGNPSTSGGPLLIARRQEGAGLPTVLTYGHAEVVPAEPQRWRAGASPRAIAWPC